MKDLTKVRTFDQVDLRHSVIRNLLGTLRDMWQRTLTLGGPWSSLVEGIVKKLVIALYTLSLLFCKFINTTAYHLGRYKPSSPVSCRAPRMVNCKYAKIKNE